MELWRISQDKVTGWDTFSDAVVAAETEEDAQRTLPADWVSVDADDDYGCWCAPEFVKVEHIGTADEGIEAGVICASFHAG